MNKQKFNKSFLVIQTVWEVILIFAKVDPKNVVFVHRPTNAPMREKGPTLILSSTLNN